MNDHEGLEQPVMSLQLMQRHSGLIGLIAATGFSFVPARLLFGKKFQKILKNFKTISVGCGKYNVSL
jgi:hypothetical protein